MLIQPFLENAVKHGMKNLNHKGRVQLNINQREDRLVIRIKDNGMGRNQPLKENLLKEEKHKSYGVDITSDRMELLNSIYHLKADLKYNDLNNPSGTEVVISIHPLTQEKTKWKKFAQL